MSVIANVCGAHAATEIASPAPAAHSASAVALDLGPSLAALGLGLALAAWLLGCLAYWHRLDFVSFLARARLDLT